MNTKYIHLIFFAGWSVHFTRRGRRNIHHHSSLAGVASFCPHTFPPTVLQTRHQTPDIGPRATEGGVQCQVQTQPEPARRTWADRASVR